MMGNLTIQAAMRGNVRARIQSHDAIEEQVTHNVMTLSGGLGSIASWLGGAVTAVAPFYFVVGSGTVPVGRFMTTVPGETWRGPIVQTDVTGNSVVYHTFLSISDNNGLNGAGNMVGCYGLVGGAATPAANTGTVFALSNAATPYNKNATTTASLDWSITISGVVS